MYLSRQYCRDIDAVCVYKVVFSDKTKEFGLQVYKEGANEKDLHNFCTVNDISPSYSFVHALCLIMESHLVLPIHAKDIVEDFLC
ncbi:MAG: hypothetical protein IJF54_06530 [Clostridia bacterium]|nr:hypothetical protein [Clostridia bacterium]